MTPRRSRARRLPVRGPTRGPARGRPPHATTYELRGLQWNPYGLRTARLRAGISQLDLAYKLSVHEDTIAQWETANPACRAHSPPINRVANIARTLGCEYVELVVKLKS